MRVRRFECDLQVSEFHFIFFSRCPDGFYRRTCFDVHSGNDSVRDGSGMEEGVEVVGGMAAGGVSVFASLLGGLCPKHPGGMDLQPLSLLELPGNPGRTG